jgi:CRP-like cAMP-binding protein
MDGARAATFTRGWPYRPAPRGSKLSRQELVARQEALRAAPLFEGIAKTHLRALARVSGVSTYPAGRAILSEGQHGSRCFVVLEGTAKVLRRGRRVASVGPGDFLGEVSLLAPGARTATVIAETDIRCLTIAGSDFRGLLEREPTLTLRIATTLAKRLRMLDHPVFG